MTITDKYVDSLLSLATSHLLARIEGYARAWLASNPDACSYVQCMGTYFVCMNWKEQCQVTEDDYIEHWNDIRDIEDIDDESLNAIEDIMLEYDHILKLTGYALRLDKDRVTGAINKTNHW